LVEDFSYMVADRLIGGRFSSGEVSSIQHYVIKFVSDLW
jgi:hypothetical protein